MAKRKDGAAPGEAAKARKQRSASAWSEHLFLNPLGNWPSYSFGVLRRSYRGRKNTAAEFGRLKLHPVDPPPPSCPFHPTAVRWETLLPPKAQDGLLNPQQLLETFDAQSLEWRTGLLIYITIRFPGEDRLHAAYEMVRAWVRSEFVDGERQLPAILIQHAPHLVGSSNPHHVHLLLFPRTVSGLGWAAYCEDALTEDHAQKTIYDSWLAHRSGR